MDKDRLEDKITKIVKYLEQNTQTISFAESCTGGRIASAFTSIGGVSSVFNGSCVTYSNEIKHLWLGVNESIFIEFGAVSLECVSAMLDGISRFASSDYAIAVSGIAGPTGGSDEKPVGTVYIGVLTPHGKIIHRYHFDGDRNRVQNSATYTAIELLERNL